MRAGKYPTQCLHICPLLTLNARLVIQVKADMLQGGTEMGFAKIEKENPWLASTPLVVKPDQLIKRRGKAGLLAVNKTWPEVQAWISERMGTNQQVCAAVLPRVCALNMLKRPPNTEQQ